MGENKFLSERFSLTNESFVLFCFDGTVQMIKSTKWMTDIKS